MSSGTMDSIKERMAEINNKILQIKQNQEKELALKQKKDLKDLEEKIQELSNTPDKIIRQWIVNKQQVIISEIFDVLLPLVIEEGTSTFMQKSREMMGFSRERTLAKEHASQIFNSSLLGGYRTRFLTVLGIHPSVLESLENFLNLINQFLGDYHEFKKICDDDPTCKKRFSEISRVIDNILGNTLEVSLNDTITAIDVDVDEIFGKLSPAVELGMETASSTASSTKLPEDAFAFGGARTRRRRTRRSKRRRTNRRR